MDHLSPKLPPARTLQKSTDSTAPEAESVRSSSHGLDRTQTWGWWIKLSVQPALILLSGAVILILLGISQRVGWISAGASGNSAGAADAASADVRYICPMMCTPPQAESGRCPVCAMELVPATSGGSDTDSRSIVVEPAARRVANIQTVAAKKTPIYRTIRAVGELSYDERALKTISAYVDGRLERLDADFTGVVVQKGENLALLYSPLLYSSQVELLLAKRALANRTARTATVVQSQDELYQAVRQRLVELGMTPTQIEALEQSGAANSRMQLTAPISGTVIEKTVVEGQYVKEGDIIYKLADLSNLWLMLKLFPEDAALAQHGQEIEAEVQSLPGRIFTGHIAFIDPSVDAKTRTVGVRVVMPNEHGLLRVGDYANATVHLPITDSGGGSETVVIPRDAVLMAGNNSVIYVETEPGRFEIRPVVLGPTVGDQIAIRSGLQEGELVATRGNFLIDSQMQLAGNPSLIDPAKVTRTADEAESSEVHSALAVLSEADRALAERQSICPVTRMPLGSMGTPPKIDVHGRPVFICCEGCRQRLLDDSDRYLAELGMTSSGQHRQPDAAPAALPEMDLPPIGIPQLIEGQRDILPRTATPPATAKEIVR